MLIDNPLAEIREWLNYVKFREFYDALSEHVIGQDGLFYIAANIYSYLYNVVNNKPINHNMILTAPSGAGKTETYRAIKRYFDVYIPSLPVYIRDASSITATGYKGSEPAYIVAPLSYTGLNRPVGLVFLDEFDKKILPSYNAQGENTNAEAQYGLLTIVEGSDVEIRVRGRIFQVNTDKVMFIGLGSFDFFRDDKSKDRTTLGFATTSELIDHYDSITREDMIEAGGCYELIGRFPTIINYHKLDNDAINRIINKNIAVLEEEYNCDIELTNELREELIGIANSQFGCRLINSVLTERILVQFAYALYNKPSTDERLVISLADDNCSYYYRDLTKEEVLENDIREDIEIIQDLLLNKKSKGDNRNVH